MCSHGITIDQPLHRGILFMVEEHCLLGRFHGGINFGTLYPIALVRTDVLENIHLRFQGSLG
jgi:hypothetical protein